MMFDLPLPVSPTIKNACSRHLAESVAAALNVPRHTFGELLTIH